MQEGAYSSVNMEEPEMTIAPAIWLQVTNQDIIEHSQYLLLHEEQANRPNTSTLCLQY